MTITLDDLGGGSDPVAPRQPGQFARRKSGAPVVAHPTKTWQPKGTKAELIHQCIERGINWKSDLDIDPRKTPTVAQLKELLGPRPAMVTYGRPSGLGKQIENTTNLQKWAERAVALGVHLDPALSAELANLAPDQLHLDDDEAKDILDGIAVKAKRIAKTGLAADRGTHGHELTEDRDNERDWVLRVERGEDLGIPVVAQRALVAAWAKALDVFGIEILAIEAPCVDDEWRLAGTLDRICQLGRDLRFVTPNEIVTLEAGSVIVLDIKTGKLRLDASGFVSWWHSYAPQVACYAKSVRYDPDTDTRTPWEWPIRQDYAVIAHLDILAALDGEAVCRLILVDLEAGRHAGNLCVAAREWERRTDVFSIPDDTLTVNVPVEPVVPIRVPDGAPVELPAPDPDPRRLTIQARIDALRAFDPDAIEHLRREFATAGLPTLKQSDTHTAAELDEIEAIVTGAEMWYGPFDPPPAPPVEPPAPAPVVEHRITREPPDEGDDLDDDTRASLRAAYDADESRKRWIGTLAADAIRAGHPFNMVKGTPGSVRRFEIYRALMTAWDVLEGDEDVCRAAIAHVTGEHFARQPTIPLGACFGALAIDEARRLIGVLDSFAGDGPPVALVVDTSPPPAAA